MWFPFTFQVYSKKTWFHTGSLAVACLQCSFKLFIKTHTSTLNDSLIISKIGHHCSAGVVTLPVRAGKSGFTECRRHMEEEP